jgi:hypothetical protein
MDIYCPIKGCNEPWDNDTLHEVAEETGKTYEEVAAQFRRIGCEALWNSKHNVTEEEQRDSHHGLTAGEAAAALYDILGDDMDGVAAMLEDMRF